MKKIIVSGCCNCPFLQIWNDGLGNGVDSITRGTCKHPSFNKELPAPSFNSPVFLSYQNGKVDSTESSKTAYCCPLPEDK